VAGPTVPRTPSAAEEKGTGEFLPPPAPGGRPMRGTEIIPDLEERVPKELHHLQTRQITG